ncbi:hypothetical protein O1M54_43345 [Streptomyces diastatochromogenes]|nr:hypothetical protein [Streptomyces diastatochromogenes]
MGAVPAADGRALRGRHAAVRLAAAGRAGLIKAAGLNRVTEECGLVADLIASPAAVRAPASFWNSYRATLAVLTEERPEVLARLLEIMPAGLGREVEDDEFWLTLLAECGAERLLTDKAAEEYDVDPADWLSRWAAFRKHGGSFSRRSPATLALVERMAPRLRADGRPVDLFTGRWHAGADLDLLDLCAAEGVPLSVPGPDVHVYLPLSDWLKDTRSGRRDLVAVGADPHFRRLLHTALGTDSSGRLDSDLLKAVAAHPVLAGVLREWLGEAADDFTRAVGLPVRVPHSTGCGPSGRSPPRPTRTPSPVSPSTKSPRCWAAPCAPASWTSWAGRPWKRR